MDKTFIKLTKSFWHIAVDEQVSKEQVVELFAAVDQVIASDNQVFGSIGKHCSLSLPGLF